MSGGPLRTAHRNCSVSGLGATPTERGPLGGVGRSMAQRDYILRLIEQMGQMLIELRNQILGRAASPKDVADGLERVAAQTGIDLALARSATSGPIRRGRTLRSLRGSRPRPVRPELRS